MCVEAGVDASLCQAVAVVDALLETMAGNRHRQQMTHSPRSCPITRVLIEDPPAKTKSQSASKRNGERRRSSTREEKGRRGGE
jgi:hypothetical protein